MKRGLFTLPVLLCTGCVYFNALYNANQTFGEAELAQRRGQAEVARVGFERSIEKASRAYQQDPDGRWADDALFLIGRAQLAAGDWRASGAALRQVIEMTGDSSLARRARVYLGAGDIAAGRYSAGLAALAGTVEEVEDDQTRGDGLLWRARARFRSGETAPWEDLDRVEEALPAKRGEVAMERLSWAVEAGASQQAIAGAAALLLTPEQRTADDSLRVLVGGADRAWGPAVAAALLERVDASPWPPDTRNRLLLDRAALRYRGGDLEGALSDADRVSGTVGTLADRARVLKARWSLEAVTSVPELESVRALLLPAIGSVDAVRLLETIKTVGLLVERAGKRGDALALFAAAELSRDSLGAGLLAQDLLLAFAGQQRGSEWEGKALLAARDLGPIPESATQRMSELDGNIYLALAEGRPAAGNTFQALESRLRSSMRNIRAQVAAEAEYRDVAVLQAARALDSIRAAEDFRRRLAAGDSLLLDSLRVDSIRVDSLRRDSLGLNVPRQDSLPVDTFRVAAPPQARMIRLPARERSSPSGEGRR